MKNQIIVLKYTKNQEKRTVTENAPEGSLLDYMYEEIGCDLVQCVSFNGFDAWVDEEGLFKKNPMYTYTDEDGNEAVFTGNIIFTKGIDNEGNTTFFDTEEDADIIMQITRMISNAKFFNRNS